MLCGLQNVQKMILCATPSPGSQKPVLEPEKQLAKEELEKADEFMFHLLLLEVRTNNETAKKKGDGKEGGCTIGP